MRIRNWWNVENQTSPEEQQKGTTLFLKDVYNILNKGITLTDNIKGALLEVTFSAADTDLPIRHGLDFVPSNYLVCGSRAATSVYDGASTADKTYFYLRATVATTVRVFLF